ncbi:MAG TPA: prepilin-type N-terminal cleavage/methylation domain-containing protein [Thermoplasmata archaeon]|nr:prepilin-type N-terminal cleavage/methylation domain-containing protein [Thermoplasmata archaeon]
MSAFSVDQIMTLTELLVTLAVIGITWAIYYGSDRAELPGEARIPDPMVSDDTIVDTEGRTL